MFTGIIERTAQLACPLGADSGSGAAGSRLVLKTQKPLKNLTEGDSISCDGICLSVCAHSADGFSADISPETRQTTNIASWRSGRRVNLERAMRWHDRMNGHMVTGHVDGTAKVLGRQVIENALCLRVELEKRFEGLIVEKGSVALNGVSLTVNEVNERDFSVMIIPLTRRLTNLGCVWPGVRVNLETDLLARYVQAQSEVLKVSS